MKRATRIESGTLYLVPTPIGNPDDITLRALQVLEHVDILACEDTRKTMSLLRHLGIPRRLISYHDHNEDSRAPKLIEQLKQGQSVALVSDAGTPLLADPGYRLVQLAQQAAVPIVSLPGASAAITALVASGMPVPRFCFVGFLPRQQARRRSELERFVEHPGSLVVFEAPHRLLECLGTMHEVLGDRSVVLARNLTKPTEQVIKGRLSELIEQLATWERVSGEFTVVIGPSELPASDAVRWERAERMLDLLVDSSLPAKTASELLAIACELPKRELYARLIERRG